MSKIEDAVIAKIQARADAGSAEVRKDNGKERPNLSAMGHAFTRGIAGCGYLCGKVVG